MMVIYLLIRPFLLFLFPEAERRRSEAVAWLGALLRDSALPLPPPRVSDEDLRAALADGALLCAALDKLACPAAPRDQVGNPSYTCPAPFALQFAWS
jgi:hypothetical protein